MMAEPNEAIDQTYVYAPFGSIDYSEGTSDNTHQFTGKEIDEESGLMYFGSRYYNSEIGRWVSRDSDRGKLSVPQGLNRYLYCYNNPFKYLDPDGNAPKSSFAWKNFTIGVLRYAGGGLSATGGLALLTGGGPIGALGGSFYLSYGYEEMNRAGIDIANAWQNKLVPATPGVISEMIGQMTAGVKDENTRAIIENLSISLETVMGMGGGEALMQGLANINRGASLIKKGEILLQQAVITKGKSWWTMRNKANKLIKQGQDLVQQGAKEVAVEAGLSLPSALPNATENLKE